MTKTSKNAAQDYASIYKEKTIRRRKIDYSRFKFRNVRASPSPFSVKFSVNSRNQSGNNAEERVDPRKTKRNMYRGLLLVYFIFRSKCRGGSLTKQRRPSAPTISRTPSHPNPCKLSSGRMETHQEK